MMFVVSIRVYASGWWTTSLWPIVGRFHYSRPRTWCNIPCNGVCILSCIPLCPGISIQMIGFFAITGCHATCIVTPCSAWRSHLPTAKWWGRSSWPTLGKAKASPCHTRAKPMRLLVSFSLGKVSHWRWLSTVQRRWNRESLLWNARKHHATCGAPSPILHGLTPPSMGLGNSSRVLPGNWLGQVHPSCCGVLYLSTNPMFAHTLLMTSISYYGFQINLKQAWLCLRSHLVCLRRHRSCLRRHSAWVNRQRRVMPIFYSNEYL